jgi:iron complex transport system substrate-binding protein
MNHKLLWVMALLLAGVALVACGGDDDGGRPAGTSTLIPTDSPAGSPYAAFDCAKEYPGTAPDDSNFPLRLADDTGVQVEMESPPDAIVSLSAAHVEVLYAIGAGDQLIAGDLFSDCPAAANELEHVDSFTPSVEAITALEPDLVFMFFDPGGLRDSLEGAGVDVFMLNTPESVTGVLDQMELLGQLTGHVREAGAFTGSMNGRIEQIVARLPEVEPPTVFHEVDTNYYSAGPGSFVGDLYDILEAENIAEATGEPFPLMSQEAIIAAAPEVIILADEDAGENAETVKARPGWDSIPAVQSGRIHTVDPDIVSRPGPRLIEALETLAELLYGSDYEAAP